MRTKIILIAFSLIITSIFFSACSEDEVKYQRYYADGSQIYHGHCQNCHMKDGSGLANVMPP